MEIYDQQFTFASRPSFAVLRYGKCEGHSSQVSAFGQIQNITSRLCIGDRQFKLQSLAVFGQLEIAGSGPRQHSGPVVIHQSQNVPAAGQTAAESATADTVPIFLAEARQRDSNRWKGNPEYFPLYLCAIHTGMRAGELAGLQWPDIDWKGKYLIVRRSIKEGKVYQTKTKRIRRIDMSDELLAELKSYRQRRLRP